VTEDIRDIRGPKHIPSPWLWPLWLAGVRQPRPCFTPDGSGIVARSFRRASAV